MKRVTIQLLIAVLLTLGGIVLLFSGFWVDPDGVIDSSVLVAFGEICTFAGALFGVDYTYCPAGASSFDFKLIGTIEIVIQCSDCYIERVSQ